MFKYVSFEKNRVELFIGFEEQYGWLSYYITILHELQRLYQKITVYGEQCPGFEGPPRR